MFGGDIWRILERYLESGTHDWREWKGMYDRESPSHKGMPRNKKKWWMSGKRIYWKDEYGALRFKKR